MSTLFWHSQVDRTHLKSHHSTSITGLSGDRKEPLENLAQPWIPTFCDTQRTSVGTWTQPFLYRVQYEVISSGVLLTRCNTPSLPKTAKANYSSAESNVLQQQLEKTLLKYNCYWQSMLQTVLSVVWKRLENIISSSFEYGVIDERVHCTWVLKPLHSNLGRGHRQRIRCK